MKYERALITGASSGLGRGIALELGRRGAHLVLTARRAELLESLAEEIRAAGGRAEVEPLDVRETERVREVVERWDRELGGLDLVLANAGVAPPDPRDKLGLESVLRVLEINLLGACATLCSALPRFTERGRGTLAGVSSLAALRGFPASGSYSASKAGLSTFLESLAADLRSSGVRVVDIQPGFVRTAMTDANDFPMPLLQELEPAVLKCVDGLERQQSIVHFPAGLSWPLRALVRPLPRPLWLLLAQRMKRRAQPPR